MEFEEINAKLNQIDSDRYEAIQNLMRPLIQKEFKKVRRYKPHWTKIIFGNGRFAIIGQEDNEDPWVFSSIVNTLRGATTEEKWKGPKYMRKLYFLLDTLVSMNVAIDDVEGD